MQLARNGLVYSALLWIGYNKWDIDENRVHFNLCKTFWLMLLGIPVISVGKYMAWTFKPLINPGDRPFSDFLVFWFRSLLTTAILFVPAWLFLPHAFGNNVLFTILTALAGVSFVIPLSLLLLLVICVIFGFLFPALWKSVGGEHVSNVVGSGADAVGHRLMSFKNRACPTITFDSNVPAGNTEHESE